MLYFAHFVFVEGHWWHAEFVVFWATLELPLWVQQNPMGILEIRANSLLVSNTNECRSSSSLMAARGHLACWFAHTHFETVGPSCCISPQHKKFNWACGHLLRMLSALTFFRIVLVQWFSSGFETFFCARPSDITKSAPMPIFPIWPFAVSCFPTAVRCLATDVQQPSAARGNGLPSGIWSRKIERFLD